MRAGLGAQIPHGGLKVFNCSNGAMIDGTQPRHGTDVSFGVPRIEHGRVRRLAEDALASYGPDEFLAGRDFGPARTETARRFDALIATVGRAETSGATLAEGWETIGPLLDHPEAGLSAIAATPAQAMAWQATFFLNRIPDDGRRRAVSRHFLGTLRTILGDMRDGILAVLDGLTARRP